MGEEIVKHSGLSSKRRLAAALVLFAFGLVVLAANTASAASYPDVPGAGTPAPTPSPTPPPAPTQSGVPPIIINIPPALGNNAPQAPVDNSAPVLLITGYHTDPSPVQSSQPFTLTLTVTNTGTKYANSIHASVGAGASFVGLGAPVSVADQLDPKQSATFSLVVQPGSLASGAYPLTVAFTYRVGESGEQGTSGSVGIQVAGSTSGVRGDPQVVVRSATPLTQPTAVGAAFDVQVVLSNAGPRKAYGVNTTLVQNDNLSAADGSGSGSARPATRGLATFQIDLNENFRPAVTNLWYVVAVNAPGGAVCPRLGLQSGGCARRSRRTFHRRPGESKPHHPSSRNETQGRPAHAH